MKMAHKFILLTIFALIIYLGSYVSTHSPKRPDRIRPIPKKARKSNTSPVWSYQCEDNQCVRVRASKSNNLVSLETCEMLCVEPPIWPKPTRLSFTNRSSSVISREHIYPQVHAYNDVKNLVQIAFSTFMNNLPPKKTTSEANLYIIFNIEQTDTKLRTTTVEKYSLEIKQHNGLVEAIINAPTIFGARHALETLSQLIWFDNMDNTLNVVHDISIEDGPQFPHRGLMIDTSRNWYPVGQLKKIVDGMAASKLNTFHLHLTDAVSFPIVLPSYPNFAKYGAYSEDKIYTAEQMKGLIKYARDRGIRTILEIDAPSHTNEGWNYGDNDTHKLIICSENDVQNGHLNPDNNEVFEVLQKVYNDLLNMGSDNEIFHIGNDEVNTACYSKTERAKYFSTPDYVWVEMTNKMLDAVRKANSDKTPNTIIWSSPLTDYYLPNLTNKDNVIVQYWLGEPDNIIALGFKVIFSTVGHWYLDCGFGPWRPFMQNSACDPYTTWQTFYSYRPWERYGRKPNQILGGEVCLWSELVGEDTMETRIWPRSAAFAERVWSDPQTFDEMDVYHRLSLFKDRLTALGIRTENIWPKYCSQNPGKCKN